MTFTIEDADNIRTIVMHHCGIPQTVDEIARYDALMNDLLRYCTRLRCQPNTKAHTYLSGGLKYQVPEHILLDHKDY